MAKNGRQVVLIVEDSKALLKAFAKRLAAYPDLEVLQAQDPSQALTIAADNLRHLDLVVLDGDLGLNKLNGAQLAEELIADGYTGTILAMSSDSDMNETMMRAGCRGKIRKDYVAERIAHFLRLEKPGSEA